MYAFHKKQTKQQHQKKKQVKGEQQKIFSSPNASFLRPGNRIIDKLQLVPPCVKPSLAVNERSCL